MKRFWFFIWWLTFGFALTLGSIHLAVMLILAIQLIIHEDKIC